MAVGVDSRHLFEDHASGAKDDRPGLAEAQLVRPGDVLVVWKLDRLGRSLSHLLSIVNALKEKQVAFRSVTEGMDTTTPSGELLFHVFGALAQYERALTQERVVAGWQQPSGGTNWRATTRYCRRKTGCDHHGTKRRHVQGCRCRNFGVKRTTLIETLARIGWPELTRAQMLPLG